MTSATRAVQSSSLEALAHMDSAALEQLFRDGKVPSSLKALDGNVAGRLLSVRHLDKTLLAAPIRYVSGLPVFPWKGKGFSSNHESGGVGSNQLSFGLHLVPFETRIEQSLLDGKDCVRFNYDQGVNPWPLNKIRDEVREVFPGVFIGPAMLPLKGHRYHVAFWFGLDTNV